MTSSTNLISDLGLLATAGFFVVGLGAVFTGSASAAEPGRREESPFSFPFKYERVELETVAGAENLLDRLEHAVRRECRTGGRVALADRLIVDKCVETTMRAAMGQIGSSTAAEAYRQRGEG
ncbi:MAG: UrcA family protein [Alphaproteobacteria bacterium]|nr:UrcA family protein [Alphaproteobacteria bacterium]